MRVEFTLQSKNDLERIESFLPERFIEIKETINANILWLIDMPLANPVIKDEIRRHIVQWEKSGFEIFYEYDDKAKVIRIARFFAGRENNAL